MSSSFASYGESCQRTCDKVLASYAQGPGVHSLDERQRQLRGKEGRRKKKLGRGREEEEEESIVR